jgi:hypothetical protein
MRDDIVGYLATVVRVEWPAQADGRTVDRGRAAFLEKLNRTAASLKPSGVADGILQALLLRSLMRLRDARQQRLLAAETAIPAVVWIVSWSAAVLRSHSAPSSAFRASVCML